MSVSYQISDIPFTFDLIFFGKLRTPLSACYGLNCSNAVLLHG